MDGLDVLAVVDVACHGTCSKKEDKNLLALFTASTICIGLFYGAGFFYGGCTHITIMEYWRWWVVHLWVEGVFGPLRPWP